MDTPLHSPSGTVMQPPWYWPFILIRKFITIQIFGKRIAFFPNVQNDEKMKAFMFSVVVDPGFVDQETSYNLEMGKLFTRKEYGIKNTKLNIMWNLYIEWEKIHNKLLDSSKLNKNSLGDLPEMNVTWLPHLGKEGTASNVQSHGGPITKESWSLSLISLTLNFPLAFRFGKEIPVFVCVCMHVYASVYILLPTRLLRPWDSPGKNTGVGGHLQGSIQEFCHLFNIIILNIHPLLDIDPVPFLTEKESVNNYQ